MRSGQGEPGSLRAEQVERVRAGKGDFRGGYQVSEGAV